MILMQRLGAAEEELDQYRRKHMNLRSVRKYYLDQAREENDTETEIELLQMSRQMDQGEAYLLHTYSKRLIELYTKQNNHDLIKAERRADLLSYPLTSMEDFRDYRRMCSAEEWKRDRELIIEFQNGTERKCQLLAEEKLYDKLFAMITKENRLN